MRARNLKPGIYKNYELARLGDASFRLFTGLWCMADRQGRLKDEPEKIQAELFPFRFQKVEVNALLDGLSSQEDPFIIRYEAKNQNYIQIVNFLDHQRPHPKEVPSQFPPSTKKLSPRLEQVTTKDKPNPSGSSDVQDLLIPGSSESPLLKTPSAKAAPFWKELIQHINDSWSRKKRGAKYLWSGKDFAALKRVLAIYQVFDVMALWDIYIGSSDEFAIRQGFNIPEFIRQLPRLVDGNWKGQSQRYMDRLMPTNTEGMDQVNALIGCLGKDIPK